MGVSMSKSYWRLNNGWQQVAPLWQIEELGNDEVIKCCII